MNQLNLTYLGKMSFVQEDLKFMQDATLEAFKGLLSAFNMGSIDSFIISGIVHSNSGGNNNSFTEGYVCLQGEIFYCPAQTMNIALGNIRFGIAETTVAPSPKTFKDLSVRNVNIQRRAGLGLYAGNPPLYTSLKRIEDIIGEKLKLQTPAACTLGSNMSGTIWALKNKMGVVTIDGTLTPALIANNQLAFTLPVGYRPSVDKIFVCSCIEIPVLDEPGQPICVLVKPNGQVLVTSVVANRSINLASIRFDV
jgi:hypothetical protein